MKKHLTVEEFRQKWMKEDPQALEALAQGWQSSWAWFCGRRRPWTPKEILREMEQGEISRQRARVAIARGHELMGVEARKN